MGKNKQAIVTFKADQSLLDALGGIPNRSDFIRSAILAALNNVCPLCRGTGILTPEQKTHWDSFAEHHTAQECGECHEWYLVCQAGDSEDPHCHEHGEHECGGCSE